VLVQWVVSVIAVGGVCATQMCLEMLMMIVHKETVDVCIHKNDITTKANGFDICRDS
jgi:hypothetical protein